jgi:MFS family permease
VKTLLRSYTQFHPNIRKIMLGMLLVGLGATFWGLFFNLYLASLGLSKAEIGSVLALNNLATALFAIPAAFLCRGKWKHTALVAGYAFAFICYVCAIFAGTSIWLSVFVFLSSGFGTLPRVVATPLMMENSNSTERSYVFSAFFLTNYVGSIVGFASAGFMRHEISSWIHSPLEGYRLALLGGLALSFSGLIPFFFMRRNAESDSQGDGSSESRFSWNLLRVLNWGFLGRALVPAILIGTGAGVIVQFMNLYFKDVFHLSDDVIGYLMAAQAVATSVGALLAPVIADKFGRVPVVVATQVLSIPFMVWMGLTHSVVVAQFCFVLRSALMNMAGPVSHAFLMESASKDDQGFLNALFACAQSATWAFAAWLYGHVLNGNYAKSFLIAAVLYAFASLFYFVFFHRMEKANGQQVTA